MFLRNDERNKISNGMGFIKIRLRNLKNKPF